MLGVWYKSVNIGVKTGRGGDQSMGLAERFERLEEHLVRLLREGDVAIVLSGRHLLSCRAPLALNSRGGVNLRGGGHLT